MAFSQVSDDGTMQIANLATGSQESMYGESKLYTEVWWDYGIVGTPSSKAFSLSADVKTVYDIDIFTALYYVEVRPDSLNQSVLYKEKQDVLELALIASKSFGPLDTSLVLSYDDIQDKDYNSLNPSDVDSSVYLTTFKVYLTYNF